MEYYGRTSGDPLILAYRGRDTEARASTRDNAISVGETRSGTRDYGANVRGTPTNARGDGIGIAGTRSGTRDNGSDDEARSSTRDVGISIVGTRSGTRDNGCDDGKARSNTRANEIWFGETRFGTTDVGISVGGTRSSNRANEIGVGETRFSTRDVETSVGGTRSSTRANEIGEGETRFSTEDNRFSASETRDNVDNAGGTSARDMDCAKDTPNRDNRIGDRHTREYDSDKGSNNYRGTRASEEREDNASVTLTGQLKVDTWLQTPKKEQFSQGIFSIPLDGNKVYDINAPLDVTQGCFHNNNNIVKTPLDEKRWFCTLHSSPGRDGIVARIATLISIVLLVGIIILAVLYAQSLQKEEVTLCQSPQCIRSAANLLASMDPTVSPCEDFYEFACGNWPEEHPRPRGFLLYDWFADREMAVIRTVNEFLQRNSTDDDPWAVQQARNLYSSCMNLSALDAMGMLPLYEALESAGLPRAPPLNLFGTSSSAAPSNDLPWDYSRVIALARRNLNLDIFVSVTVYPGPTDRSTNRLHVGRYRDDGPLPGLQHVEERILGGKRRTRRKYSASEENEQKLLEAYAVYMVSVMKVLGKASPASLNVTAVATQVLLFSKELAEIAKNTTKGRPFRKPTEMTLSELQNFTNSQPEKFAAGPLNWKTIIDLIFQGTNVSLNLNGDDTILIDDETYLVQLADLLSKTNLSIVALSQWWAAVDTLASFVAAPIRQLRTQFEISASEGTPESETDSAEGAREVSIDGGGEQSLTAALNTPSVMSSRDLECASSVNQFMGMAVAHALYERDPSSEDREQHVMQILGDIQEAFTARVNGLDWMDRRTKTATLDKMDSMRTFIGYPKWFKNNSALNWYYHGINMTEDSYLYNLLSFQRLIVTYSLENLRLDPLQDEWATDPTEVNAFHVFQDNSITVPAAILQFPYYDLGLEALNYGAIGSVLGHELTHAFDNTGRQFDKDGRLRQWWSNETIAEYEKRTQCFVKQYGGYWMSDIQDYVDGELTLGENIADNGGIHDSFAAYQLWRQKNNYKTEPSLPGLTSFSSTQLLFLSYANVWCESLTREGLRKQSEDEHSPNRVRTWGALTNSEDFAKVWECPQGTTMNPGDEGRCQIW